jgi:hypothetical protein
LHKTSAEFFSRIFYYYITKETQRVMTRWCSPREDLGTSKKKALGFKPIDVQLDLGCQELVGRVCYCAFNKIIEDLDGKWKIVHV